jgi:hypothetical protein
MKNHLIVLSILVLLPLTIFPIKCEIASTGDDWGVIEGEEYEFTLNTCTLLGSTLGTNYSLHLGSDLVALQGEHWIVTIIEVNETGIFQTITKGSTTTPVHQYQTYYFWFWQHAGNTTYWQEEVDTYNDANYTENNPGLYSLDEWTLAGGIYTEHREYVNSVQELKKFSIHVDKGITTEYELKYNESASGAEFLKCHHLKFTLLTDLGDGVPNSSDDILASILTFITENPELTLLIGGGFFVLSFGFILLRRRRGKKKSRRKR